MGEHYLIQLAEFFRVAISHNKQFAATLQEELSVCKNYLEMQQIRFGAAMDWELVVENTEQLKGHINVPIIFCTAYNDYAIEAFKVNGIEYILKPFSKESLEKAISKFENLKKLLADDIVHQYEAAMKALSTYQLKDNGTHIKYRDRFLPISFDKIALFYLENEINHLYTHSGKIYSIPENLEELERQVSTTFFRVNRQFLVNRNAIRDATEHFPRKLKVNLKFPFSKDIIVSKEKKSPLLEWLVIANE